MSSRILIIFNTLSDIEQSLRDLALWESTPPSAEALASREPFAIDTLSFPQWLQFIFIPRLRELISAQKPLPSMSGVHPMAEQYFQVLPLNSQLLLAQLKKMDALLSGSQE